jgi:hypothetical protein
LQVVVSEDFVNSQSCQVTYSEGPKAAWKIR